MDESIFVQIASYRDPELVPTILDMYENAHNPEALHVCICWQHDDSENLDVLRSYSNIEIIDIPYYESKGACWARNQIQRRYNGQRYTMQLDSHHRFVQGWDTELKMMYNQCKNMGSEKPLITAYIPAFDPFADKSTYELIPWKMDFHKFLADGPIFFVPSPINDYEFCTAPVPSRFYSAHFAFADGKFCEEVPHDPEFYFYGEEISIAVRAFTHGYDLYHPHKVVCWHEYTRSARFKHWDDHDLTKQDIKGIKQSWWERDIKSQKRNRVLFGMEQDEEIVISDKYNFGKIRTLSEYERYAGVKFSTKEVCIYTLSGKLAPTPYNENYVDGHDPITLSIISVSPIIDLNPSILNNKGVNKLTVSIYDDRNRLIQVNTFSAEIIGLWQNSTNKVSFNVHLQLLVDNKNLHCEVKSYDIMGRELSSYKNKLIVDFFPNV